MKEEPAGICKMNYFLTKNLNFQLLVYNVISFSFRELFKSHNAVGINSKNHIPPVPNVSSLRLICYNWMV